MILLSFAAGAIQVGLAAEAWTLPFFTSDPNQVLEEAQHFQPPGESDLYLIDLKVSIVVDAQGRASTTRRSLFRVMNEIGVKQLANISEPWLSWRQQKPSVRVRVITVDGQAHALDPATITEANVPGTNDVYADVKLIQARLPAVAAKSVVELEIQEGDREPVIPGERYDRYSVQVPYPIRHVTIQIQSPANLRAAARGFEDIKRSESHQNGLTKIVFEAWDLKKFKAKSLLPPELPSGPEIEYTTAHAWQSVAAWYATVTDAVIGIADPPVQAAPEPSSVSAVMALQGGVRYTGLELGMSAYVPGSPQQTLQRRYGDCKDKSALLVSRLRGAGIPAKVALLTPYPLPDVDSAMPGLEAFSHAIVYIPGPHPLWIDPTLQYPPVTRLPAADQGRSALIVDPATKLLVKTPESPPDENRLAESFSVKMQPHGKPEVEGQESYAGVDEDVIRPLFAMFSSAPQLKSRVEEQLTQQMRVSKLNKLDTSLATALEEPFWISWAGSGWELGKTEGSTAWAATPSSSSLGAIAALFSAGAADDESTSRPGDAAESPNKKEERARKEDLYLPAAHTIETRYKIIAPSGFSARQVPELKPIELGVLKIDRSAAVLKDHSVEISYRFEIPRRRFTAVEAQAIAGGLKAFLKTSAPSIQFTDDVQRLLEEGQEKEALKLARGRVVADPKATHWLVQLASTLSVLGAQSEAIRTCQKACELDPKSAEAFAMLAELYATDEMGRPLHSGMQLDKAIAAQRKAVELEPDNKRVALTLSKYYEYNNRGEHYGKGARIDDAIASLRTMETDLPNLNAGNSLSAALTYSRRYTDLKNYYAKGASGASVSFKIAVITITEGIEAAKRAFDQSGSTESPQTVFRDAARAALWLREYSAGVALLREEEKQNSGSESLQGAIDTYTKARPRETAMYAPDPAIAVTQRLIYALFDPADQDSWRKLFVPEWRDLANRPERDEMWNFLSAYHRLGGQNLWMERVADVAVGNAAFIAEGSAESGYRVRFADPSSNGSMRTVAWIVKRGDEYLVAGLANDIAIAGSEALKAALRGDREIARQWLDWLREDQTPPKGVDPLAGLAFLKLWPVAAPANDDMILAAASLAILGKHFDGALTSLRDLEKRAGSRKRNEIDYALVPGLMVHHMFADAIGPANRLVEAFPASDSAFVSYVRALTHSGAYDRAEKTTDARLEKEPNSVIAIRAKGDLLSEQGKYSDAVAAYQTLSKTPKVAASDWNQLAWISLFTGVTGNAALDAANTAMRLTQNRSRNIVHTLGCVQAATGDTASARKQLKQYLELTGSDEIDDAARLLSGLIAEQLGFHDLARERYGAIKKAEFREATSTYELAQLRLAVMNKNAVTPVQ